MSALTLILSLLVSFGAFAQTETTPTRAVTGPVKFEDDMDLANLELALDRQLQNFSVVNLNGKIRYGTKVYPRLVLKESAEEMRRLVRETRACLSAALDKAVCWSTFNVALNGRFDIYTPVPAASEPGHNQANTTKFTAYYSLDLNASRTESAQYNLPIYKLPPTEALRTLSREAIDYDNRLAGKGLELFWVDGSRFDLYNLHIEGGGRVHLKHEDGSEEYRYLSYAGRNGQTGEFISRYMKRRGYIDDTSMYLQERFLAENPALHREIYSTYKAYIYFKETDEEPHGVQNIPLTEGRSLAIDTGVYKSIGVITFVQAQKPVQQQSGESLQVPFSRFFVTQDTGGAIKGNARADLYMGFGKEAAHIGQNMQTLGKQYFLIKK